MFPIITLITAFTYLFWKLEEHRFCSMERGRGNQEEAEMLIGKHLCDADRHRSDPDSHRPYLLQTDPLCFLAPVM